MKKTWIAATLILLSMSFSSYANADLKVVFFDAQKVLDNIEEGKDAVAKLEKDAGEKKKQIDAKQKELVDLDSEINRGALVFDKDTMAKKKQDLERKKMEFQRLYAEAQGDIQKQEMTMRGEIFKKINALIEKVGKDESYDFILEKNEGGVLYAKGGDITEKVIELYNKQYGGKSGKKK
ncbi:MAG: OmpH family outer membrane protein [Bdellovibrionota bacterium]